jgi:Arc/MetJ-type ribon-helix-helix transcriptional regulator
MSETDKSEKITVNVGVVDLGEIDLLVREGFYANRTEFVRIAIRAQLAARAAAVEQTVARKTLVLGTRRFTRRELEELRERGATVEIRVLGLASIADDVTAELARATITSVEVLGAFRASEAVKAALADRMV